MTDIKTDYADSAIVALPPLYSEYSAEDILEKWLKSDGGDYIDIWRDVFEALKPGAHMVVFSDNLTQDLTSIAVRMAGFEIRDVIQRLDAESGHHPIIMARKPLHDGSRQIGTMDCVERYGTGAINIDASRIGDEEITTNGRGSMSGATPIVPQAADYVGATRTGRFPANCITEESNEFYSKYFEVDNTLDWLIRLITPPRGEVIIPFDHGGRISEAVSRFRNKEAD